MKRFLQSGAGAAVLWVTAAVIVAAVIAPLIYGGGQALAYKAAAGQLSGFLESIGKTCVNAKFTRFFNRSLMGAAIALLPLLMKRMRHLEASAGPTLYPLVKTGAKAATGQVLTGVLIAGGLLWFTGMLLTHAGAFEAGAKPPSAGKLIGMTLPAAVLVPLFEEWLFRGVLLGLWLRFAKPLGASIGVSLFFAFLHFLTPPDGTVIANPSAPWAGFELLGKALFHFTDPQFFITDFATLFCIGMILAWARLRTSCLWFAMGLHAGWIAAFKTMNSLYDSVDASPWHPWGVGENMRSGLVPLCALLVTAFVCHFAMKKWDRNPKPFH